jgi:hypothetical protein
VQLCAIEKIETATTMAVSRIFFMYLSFTSLR